MNDVEEEKERKVTKRLVVR